MKSVDWDELNLVLVRWLERRRRARSGDGPPRRRSRVVLFGLLAAERVTSEGAHLAGLMFLTAPLALDLGRSQLYLLWAAITGLMLGSILASRGLSVADVSVHLAPPRRVTVDEPTELELHVRNGGAVDHVSLRAAVPMWSWQPWQARALGLRRLAAGSTARLVFGVRFSQRGVQEVGRFRVQAVAPFGLALGTPARSAPARVVVVPRVARVAPLVLARARRRHTRERWAIPRLARSADSRELAGVRGYRPGDAVKDLHARTWARTGQPFVREYQEEFFTHVLVWIDVAAGAPREVEAALSLGAGVLQQLMEGGGETLVDLFVGGSGDAGEPLPLGRGRGSMDAALEHLARVRAPRVLDLATLRGALVPRAAEVASVVVVSAVWDAQRAGFMRELQGCGTECRVLALSAAADGMGDGVQVVDPALVLRGDLVT